MHGRALIGLRGLIYPAFPLVGPSIRISFGRPGGDRVSPTRGGCNWPRELPNAESGESGVGAAAHDDPAVG